MLVQLNNFTLLAHSEHDVACGLNRFVPGGDCLNSGGMAANGVSLRGLQATD